MVSSRSCYAKIQQSKPRQIGLVHTNLNKISPLWALHWHPLAPFLVRKVELWFLGFLELGFLRFFGSLMFPFLNFEHERQDTKNLRNPKHPNSGLPEGWSWRPSPGIRNAFRIPRRREYGMQFPGGGEYGIQFPGGGEYGMQFPDGGEYGTHSVFPGGGIRHFQNRYNPTLHRKSHSRNWEWDFHGF